jgi:hypothetical protein
MAAHQEVASEEAAVPLYNNQAITYDPDEKLPGEKSHHSTPYDPVYPSLQYDHQFSDSASITSSIYNVPPVTPAQPQDYSNQYYYNANVTAPPRMYAPPTHRPNADV